MSALNETPDERVSRLAEDYRSNPAITIVYLIEQCKSPREEKELLQEIAASKKLQEFYDNQLKVPTPVVNLDPRAILIAVAKLELAGQESATAFPSAI